MAGSRSTAYAVIIGILSACVVFMAVTNEVPLEIEPSLRLELPDRIGNCVGVAMFHCQNGQCALSFPETELADTGICPECGSMLARVSVAEQNLLSPGTEVRRKRYTDPEGNVFMVSIVLSGRYRRSIHRPQQCIEAQGFIVNARRVIQVPLEDGDSLALTVLDVNGRGMSAYAYWFTANEHHAARYAGYLWRTAMDAALHNIRRRWAYVSIAASGGSNRERLHSRIAEFAAELQPAL